MVALIDSALIIITACTPSNTYFRLVNSIPSGVTIIICMYHVSRLSGLRLSGPFDFPGGRYFAQKLCVLDGITMQQWHGGHVGCLCDDRTSVDIHNFGVI